MQCKVDGCTVPSLSPSVIAMYISMHVVYLLLLSLHSAAHRACFGLQRHFGALSLGEHALSQSSGDVGHQELLSAPKGFDRLSQRAVFLDEIQLGDTMIGHIHKRAITPQKAEKDMEEMRLEIDHLKDLNGPDSAQSLLQSKDIMSDSNAGRMADHVLEEAHEYLLHAHRTLRILLNQAEKLEASGHAEVAHRYEKMVYDWWHHFVKWFEAWMQAGKARAAKKAESSSGKIGNEKAKRADKTGGKSLQGDSKSGGSSSKRGSGSQSGLRKGFLG